MPAGIAARLCLALAISLPAAAHDKVGANLNFIGDFRRNHEFVDVVKQSRRFLKIGFFDDTVPANLAPVGSEGWPTTDFRVFAMAAQQDTLDLAGTYKIIFTGQATLSTTGGGEGTIRIAPGRYRDCAVQEAGSVAFVAAQPGQAIFDAAICEQKATLVLRGQASHVEGIVFTHMEVPDGNGAGIRMEQGTLTVKNATFADGQSGILAANDLTDNKMLAVELALRDLGSMPSDECRVAAVRGVTEGLRGVKDVTPSKRWQTIYSTYSKS